MAFLEERNGRFRVAFQHHGKLHRVSLGAADQVEAEGSLARVEENLRLLTRGRLDVPADADLALFLLSDGKVTTSHRAARPAGTNLGQLRELYLASQETAVEENTLYTLRLHFKHLTATLGEGLDLDRLKLADLERHVARRLKMPGRRGKPLNPDTVRKEIRTLSAAWAFGAQRKLVVGALPAVELVYPKTTERPPFRTRAEIDALIARGGQGAEVWESLFLTLADVEEVLQVIREGSYSAWIHPMACFVNGGGKVQRGAGQMGDTQSPNYLPAGLLSMACGAPSAAVPASPPTDRRRRLASLSR